MVRDYARKGARGLDVQLGIAQLAKMKPNSRCVGPMGALPIAHGSGPVP